MVTHMKTIIVGSVGLCWFLIVGSVMNKPSVAFPDPIDGFREEPAEYDEPIPDVPLRRHIDCNLETPTLQLSLTKKELVGHDGIAFSGKLRVDHPHAEVVYLEIGLSRTYKNTTQYLRTHDVGMLVSDGAVPVDIAIKLPECSGELSLTLTALPFGADGELVVQQPKLLVQGVIAGSD